MGKKLTLLGLLFVSVAFLDDVLYLIRRCCPYLIGR
jgi:hypothetical protein